MILVDGFQLHSVLHRALVLFRHQYTAAWPASVPQSSHQDFKNRVPEPYLWKSGGPTIQKNIASFIGVPAPKMGVQDCKSAVSESSTPPPPTPLAGCANCDGANLFCRLVHAPVRSWPASANPRPPGWICELWWGESFCLHCMTHFFKKKWQYFFEQLVTPV